MELSNFREEYSWSTLRRKDLSLNPFEQFHLWFNAALSLPEPNAMQLATSHKGHPSLRTVLLKSYDGEGFVFFTNYESRKAHDLEENPYAALLFFWKEQDRQVTLEGSVKKTSHEESAAYFASRPRSSQLGTLTSFQGQPLDSREVLEKRFQHLQKAYEGKPIPLPSYWGGFRLVPERFEFWQGRPFRLHDRFQYTLKEGHWILDRLSP